MQNLLLKEWHKIDKVTSNRIRFLFFVDNSISMSGYPERPVFSESQYMQNNRNLYDNAANAGFGIRVRQTAQETAEHSIPIRKPPNLYPEKSVRNIAQQLG